MCYDLLGACIHCLDCCSAFHRFGVRLIERTCLLDGCLGDRGVLEGCDIELMIDEDLLQSLSDGEANLINSTLCGWCTVDEFALPIVTGLVASFLREG